MVKTINSGDLLSSKDLENHIKIYAGPGAGKTHFLVENVKNIVSNHKLIADGIKRKVLCITYTNKAVNEIVDRLQNYNDYAECYTIHGFVIEHIIKPFQSDLIRVMEEDFSIKVSSGNDITSQIEGLSLLHGIDKVSIYNFIYNKIETKSTNEYSKINMEKVQIDTKSFIESLKNENEYNFRLVKPNKIDEQDLIPIKNFIWSKARKLTHDEILFFGFRILQTNPVALYILRVKFPFIFIDEFQDTNPLQTEIIKLIGEKSTKIIVVGDVAQSIYSFQGAKISDFIDFRIEQEILEYAINGNRRSTTNIINFCNYLRQSDASIWQLSERKYEEIDKDTIESIPIKFLIGNISNFDNIIGDVLNNNGVILTRGWADAFNFVQNIKMEQSNVLRRIYNSYYSTPIQLRDEIREHNSILWVRAFKFIFKLWESYKKKSFADIILAFEMYFSFDSSKIKPDDIFLIGELSQIVFEDTDSNTLTSEIIDRFNNTIIKDEYIKLTPLFKEGSMQLIVFSEYDYENLIKNVNLLEWETSYRLFNEVFSENSKYMTVHQAKGLEWKKVIVSVNPNSFDSKAGVDLHGMFNSPEITSENSLHEFTRLYYVACSRAKDELFIQLENSSFKSVIEKALDKFQDEKGIKINYEFIT